MWLCGEYKRHPSFLLAGVALTPAWSIWGKVGGMNSAKNCEKLVWNMWPWTDWCRNQTAHYVIVYKHSLHKALCWAFWTCTLLLYKIVWTLLDTDIEFSLSVPCFFFNLDQEATFGTEHVLVCSMLQEPADLIIARNFCFNHLSLFMWLMSRHILNTVCCL